MSANALSKKHRDQPLTIYLFSLLSRPIAHFPSLPPAWVRDDWTKSCRFVLCLFYRGKLPQSTTVNNSVLLILTNSRQRLHSSPRSIRQTTHIPMAIPKGDRSTFSKTRTLLNVNIPSRAYSHCSALQSQINIFFIFAYFVRPVQDRFSSDILCDPYEYVIDVDAGKVVSHGPAAPVEGALPMELPTVSMRPCSKRP